jgi:AMP-binding enzyme C-terminal domain
MAIARQTLPRSTSTHARPRTRLVGLGICRHDRVGYPGKNSNTYLELLLGTANAGADVKTMFMGKGFSGVPAALNCNVYAIEVESALCEHPAVLMAAVIGVPHDDWGEAVRAEVVLRQQATAFESDLMAYAKTQIVSCKALKSVRIASEPPLSPVGTMLRRQVRAPYWEGRDHHI